MRGSRNADRPRIGCLRMLAAVIGVIAVMPAAASAQAISGRVLDDDTNAPLQAVDIVLVDSAGADVATVASDSAGYFRVAAPPGRYRVRVQRIGYATITSDEIVLRAGEPVIVELRMSVRGIPLEPLVVEARGSEQGRFGFMRRRELGLGTFMNSDSMDLRYPREVSDAFRAADGIDLVESFRGSDYIRSMRGHNCIAVFVDHYPHPFAMFGSVSRLREPPRIMLGFKPGSSEGLNMFDIGQVLGIEVYPSFREVPEELQDDTRFREILPCGIAIVWTGRGW